MKIIDEAGFLRHSTKTKALAAIPWELVAINGLVIGDGP